MRRSVMGVLGFALLISALPVFAESNADVEKALQSKEQAGWQAWKDHDKKACDAILSEDAVNIAGGTMDKGKQQIIKSAFGPGCQVASFSLSNFSYMWLDKDTVLMTYAALLRPHDRATADRMTETAIADFEFIVAQVQPRWGCPGALTRKPM